jgi:anti-repressor protein
MSVLVKVELGDINQPLISARGLYERLDCGQDFTSWFKYQAEKLDIIEGEDFTPILVESTGGRPGKDYIMPIDIAKHIAMMSGGKRAKALRQEFIEIEKAWNSPEKVMARALEMAHRTIANFSEEIKMLKPKAEFFDQVADSKDAISIRDAAKVLNIPNIGQNKLFQLLREKKILMRDNLPYQEFCDRGYFRVIEQKYTDKQGEPHINFKTLVYQKGVDFIRRTVEG